MQKRSAGSKEFLRLPLGISFLILCMVLIFAETIAAEPAKEKRGKKEEPYALISGTVFRDTGLALPGAELLLIPGEASVSGRKLKKLHANSDSRGEFAFRLPPLPVKYTLTVKASGYQQQMKALTVTGEDRLDVFFRLEPASK